VYYSSSRAGFALIASGRLTTLDLCGGGPGGRGGRPGPSVDVGRMFPEIVSSFTSPNW